MIPLDDALRSTWLFGATAHEGCDRCGYYNRDYDCEVQFVPETFAKAFVRMTVRIAAMEVLDEMKNDDRKKLQQVMYEDVLEESRASRTQCLRAKKSRFRR